MANNQRLPHGRRAQSPSENLRIGLVSTYPPRQCGLGSYAKDLRDALLTVGEDCEVLVAAIDRDGLQYGDEVAIKIRQHIAADYTKAAAFFAAAHVDVVLIQHEYGIFGGKPDWFAGEYALYLSDELQRLGVPYVVTLHTTLSQPLNTQRLTSRQLCANAAAVTVFTEKAKELAIHTGIVDADRVMVVSHGSPPVLRRGKALLESDDEVIRPCIRALLDELKDRRVLMTFGLLGPNKGLEIAIEGMAEVIADHPSACYLIAGATHPEEVRRYGERYREQLKSKAAELGMTSHVRFVEDFLSPEELAVLLARTDVYITPYRYREQISSGTLTFALAAGCPVVSTPYYYAEDVVGDRYGRLVPFEDAPALGTAVADLLSKDVELAAIKKRVSQLGSRLTWPAIARQFLQILQDAAHQPVRHWHNSEFPVPPLRLDHAQTMSDDGGIIQFSQGSQPDPDTGYCVDDVIRLALVAAWLRRLKISERQANQWLTMSMQFIEEAVEPFQSGLRNMRAINGTWLDQPHLGDHVGRTVWVLGEILASPVSRLLHKRSMSLLQQLLKDLPQLPALRPAAGVALGLAIIPNLPVTMKKHLRNAAERLSLAYDATADAKWRWFEDELTYDNARLPQALLRAGQKLHDKQLINKGLASLRWYAKRCGLALTATNASTIAARPVKLVGNDWLSRKEPAEGPGSGGGIEQPLDAAALVETLVDAWQITGNRAYATAAYQAFTWFLGNNQRQLWLYDPLTGGCHDGIYADGTLNPNLGAESTLAYDQALLALSTTELVSLEQQRPSISRLRLSTSGAKL